MSHLNINLEETPEEVPPIPGGDYTLEVFETPVIEDNASGEGQHLTVPMRVADEDSDYYGRQVRDFIGLDNQNGHVRVKQLCMAAGVEYGANGCDLNDFVGKTLQATLVQRKSRKPDDDRTFTNVRSYHFK